MTRRRLKFAYESRPSELFGSIRRPVATAYFFSPILHSWIEFKMLVDTGADFTLLPLSSASRLGFSLARCEPRIARGIGGSEAVYLYRGLRMRLGTWERDIVVGFVARKNLPPLLGRHECLDTFDLRFARFVTTFATLAHPRQPS